MSSEVIKYFVSWLCFKDSERGGNTDSTVFCNKNENSRWTVTRDEKTFDVYTKLNTHQRIFNRVLRCHQIICVMDYLLKIHSVVEIQI